MNLKKLIKKYLKFSYYALEDAAKINYNIFYNYVVENHKTTNVNALLLGVIFTCVATDEKFSEKEWNFVQTFIGGYSYEEALNVGGQFCNSEAKDIARKVIATVPSNIKEALIEFIVIIMCVDGEVDKYESEFLSSLI